MLTTDVPARQTGTNQRTTMGAEEAHVHDLRKHGSSNRQASHRDMISQPCLWQQAERYVLEGEKMVVKEEVT